MFSGIPDDNQNLVYAWEAVRPSEGSVPMAGNLATKVEQEGSKLRLIEVLPSLGSDIFMRCIVGRKSGDAARYASEYFRIGGVCETGE